VYAALQKFGVCKIFLSTKKATEAVTGAVPFQKVNFCPF